MIKLEHSNFHQTVDARGYDKYTLQWGELETIGQENILDTGNWDMHEQLFNL